jgi:hypothetical protein
MIENMRKKAIVPALLNRYRTDAKTPFERYVMNRALR